MIADGGDVLAALVRQRAQRRLQLLTIEQPAPQHFPQEVIDRRQARSPEAFLCAGVATWFFVIQLSIGWFPVASGGPAGALRVCADWVRPSAERERGRRRRFFLSTASAAPFCCSSAPKRVTT